MVVNAAHANHTVTIKEDPKSVDYFIHYADQILVGKIDQVSSTNLNIHVEKVFKGSPDKEFSLRIKPTIIKTLNGFDKSCDFLFFIDFDPETQVPSLFAGENGLMPLIKIQNRTYAAFYSETVMPDTPDDTRFFVPNPNPCDNYEQCFPYWVLEVYIPDYMKQIMKNEEKGLYPNQRVDLTR